MADYSFEYFGKTITLQNCKDFVGVWKERTLFGHNNTGGSNVVVWTTLDNEYRGWFLVPEQRKEDIVDECCYGWLIVRPDLLDVIQNNYPDVVSPYSSAVKTTEIIDNICKCSMIDLLNFGCPSAKNQKCRSI